MDEEARWQGKVDAKLDAIEERLTDIQKWQVAHERLDMQRFANLAVMVDHDQELRKQIKQLADAVIGNGKEGLMVKVDRNTNTISGIKKFLWLIIGAAITVVASAVIAIL